MNQPKDFLDDDFPVENLSIEAQKARQAMLEKINTYGMKVDRYPDETVKAIWEDIFIHNLSDQEVAVKHGCNSKYSWNIRHDRVRKNLLRQLRIDYLKSLEQPDF